MEPNAELVVSAVRRKRTITVRWSAEYILGRFLLLLGSAQSPAGRRELIQALVYLERPDVLLRMAQVSGYEPSTEAFPEHLLETLSHPLPLATPRYDRALSLGIAKGLIHVSRKTHVVRLSLTESGRYLFERVSSMERGDVERAHLAMVVATQGRDGERDHGTY